MVKLSIITLNFRTPDVTNECIDAFWHMYKSEFEDGIFEYIVVDNHSEDDSAKIIKKHVKEKQYKGVSFFESPVNGGFGAGNNFGEMYAKGEVVLFLNSDTKVHDKKILEMLSFLKDYPKVGIIGGQLTGKDGLPQVSAWKFYSLINVFFLLLGLERLGIISSKFNKVTKVDWVTGGCLMIKKEVFEKIGRFDEKIFMYTEDMEICYRAKQAGFTTYFYPFISITHLSQRSSNRAFAIVNIYKGILYFYRKHKPHWQYFVVKLLLKCKAAILFIIGMATGNSYLRQTYEKAFAVS